MKIAQVAPLFESVPPKLYGGTERVVSYLTEELVREGHEVTLFASGDSVTQAKLVACSPRSLRLDEKCIDPFAHIIVMLDKVMKLAHCFDVIHFHTDYFQFPFMRRLGIANVTTMHGRLDLPDLVPLFRQFSQVKVISISDAQREPLAWANWQGTVHHGLPLDLYNFKEEKGDYLAFLGRVSPEKRVDRAIEIAKKTGMKLKIAAKVDKADQEYYETTIKPMLDDPLVEFIGEIGEDEKGEFLGNAYALLFPIDWPEPFGLVMTEAMACGTPVIAFEGGSVPEVIEDGANGFICTSIDEAVAAVAKVDTIDRRRCRAIFEEKFSAPRMAKDYLEIYSRISAAALLEPAGVPATFEVVKPASSQAMPSAYHTYEARS